MNWKAIKIEAVLAVLREIENNSILLTPTQSVVYSDGKEELTIIYRNLEEKK